jgi:hypothetical protein
LNYRNLDLELSDYRAESGAEHFCVRVLDSPQGNQRTDLADAVVLPAKLRKRLGTLERGKLSLTEMISLGKELGDSLFPPRARWFLDQSRGMLGDDEGLRIRLRLETYALADLPWEYAYISLLDTPAGQKSAIGFLVLDRRTSLVRYEVLGQSPGTLHPVGAGPLRMVVLLADPRVREYHELDLEAELGNIQKTVGDVPDIQLDPYMHTTRQILLDAVQKGNAHLLHFAGHGEFQGDQGQAYGTVEGEGYLVLEGNGKADLFDADTLALLLRGRGVRLAVLGACETGRRDGVNAWTGVVPALTRAGIPAVVGNQYRIKDKNAITFSRSFYRALTGGESIDAAVTDGRQAIFALSGAADRDWGVPVLHLRAEEGVLFPKPKEPPVAKLDKSTERKPPPPPKVDKGALRKAMVKRLDSTSLATLCADVQGDLEKDGIDLLVSVAVVGGTGMVGWVLNLIDYLDRRGYLDYLVSRLQKSYSWVMDEYKTLV